MAFAIKSVKSLNALQIKQNGKNSSEAYTKFMRFLETHEHFKEDDFTWYIPLHYFEEWMAQFSYISTMTETVGSILGTEKPNVVNPPIIEKHLEKMKLPPFPFQTVGISFLVDIERGILADEMGLGKTSSALGASLYLLEEEKIQKILVICPSAVKYQWLEEIEKFTPYKGMVLDGTKKKRERLLKEYTENDIPFLLLNYELARNDIKQIKQLPFQCVILDEAHRMKNRKSLTFQSISQLEPTYRFALTGTPMQNKPEEAFALMSWLNPKVFGGITNFRKKHVVVGEGFGKKFVDLGYKNLDEIREKMAPYLLRRMKIDVADDLPDIIHTVSYCEMNAPQKALYLAIQADKELVQENIREIYETNPKAQNDPNFKCPEEDLLKGFRYMQVAVSDHPHLLLQGKSNMAKKYLPLLKKCKTSPKMEELMEILRPLIEENHKIVIFSSFVSMIKILTTRIQDLFKQNPYLITGEVKALDRQEQITRFREQDDRQIMICSDAANYGINLQFADVLINYDLPWNPAVLDQRYGRIHRIGSTHQKVTMIDMATRETIDETILKTLDRKRSLNKGLVEKTEEEKELLKKQIEALI